MSPGFALSSFLRLSSPALRQSTSHIRRFISSSTGHAFPPRIPVCSPTVLRRRYLWATGSQQDDPSSRDEKSKLTNNPENIHNSFKQIRLHTELQNSAATAPQTNEQIWAAKSQDAQESLARDPIADAYTGRSVNVVKENVGEAYRLLDGILARNKVRGQLRLAERHEKKGAKRRRLSSERWRKQFANEVRKKVQLVIKIRNRGA